MLMGFAVSIRDSGESQEEKIFFGECRVSPRPSSSTFKSPFSVIDEEERRTDSNKPPSPSSAEGEGEARKEHDDHQAANLQKVISWVRERCSLDPPLSQD